MTWANRADNTVYEGCNLRGGRGYAELGLDAKAGDADKKGNENESRSLTVSNENSTHDAGGQGG